MIAAEQEAKNSLERQVSSLVGERTRQLELLREVSELLQSCQTLEEAFDVVGQLAGRCFPGASGAVCIIRESRDGVEVKVTWDNPHMQRGAVFVPEECWALRRGRIHQVDPSAISVQCAHLEGDEPVAYFCLPLSAYGEALGMLHISSGLLTSDEVPDDWLSLRRTLAEELADPLSLALANLKLRETLRQQSIRDPLTGLFNRRYMEETLHRELRRAARTQQSLAVLMLDIDHFKQFNDSFGHDAGDELLRHLGGVLQRGTRSADIACRYGGEEFTVILPGATREQARQRAEVLRGATKAMDVSYLGQHLGAVTISIGLAAFSDDGETVEGLLREADQALYRAKSSGRDRVETAREVSPRVEDEALDDATPPVPIRSTGA
jgi:diguanylate cyclase (GGDEF)-like protein